MVRVWYKNLKGLSMNRKLSAMYLVNDVVQNSRKRVSYAAEKGHCTLYTVHCTPGVNKNT